MIKKLRIKFIAIATGSLCIIFLLLLGAISITMSMRNEKQVEYLMRRLADNNGILPVRDLLSPSRELAGLSNIRVFNRSFSILLDHDNQIINFIDQGRTSLSAGDITDFVQNVLRKNKAKGSIDEYHYLIADKNYGKIIVFVDYSVENTLITRLVHTCLVIGLIGVLIFFIIVVCLSCWATKPIQIAFDKQKQFISDASHEIKTPLTIISTNASVLEGEIGTNKWLQYIQSNIKRLNLLTNNLLDLTRLESPKQTLSFQKFNLSKAILHSALPFESTAYETGKFFNLSIPENIMYFGSEDSIRQLVMILLDNAFKYSNPNGTIAISLSINNNKRLIKVFNTGAGIAKSDYNRIFERFYRQDDSRARNTGGYGLGLAIAKSIADTHKGHIFIDGQEGQWVSFHVML